MTTDMSADERRAFLSAGTRTAKLAVIRVNGAPHVVPIWFVLDGDDVVFTTGGDTVKGKAIRRDGRVALCVDDDRSPYSFVTIEGTARVGTDLDEMLPWATRLGARYMGAERAEAFGRRNAVAGELLVRVVPTRIIARANISD
jgi:PPOX class probable F420-dependent enzyme